MAEVWGTFRDDFLRLWDAAPASAAVYPPSLFGASSPTTKEALEVHCCRHHCRSLRLLVQALLAGGI